MHEIMEEAVSGYEEKNSVNKDTEGREYGACKGCQHDAWSIKYL